MSDITKSVLQGEIKKCSLDLSEHNDATKVVAEIKAKVTSLIKSSIQSANSTSSIDERLKCLIEGLQAIMNFVEDAERLHLLKYNEILSNAKLLTEVLEKVDKKIDEEKKDDASDKPKQEPTDI